MTKNRFNKNEGNIPTKQKSSEAEIGSLHLKTEIIYSYNKKITTGKIID